jgi:hypothetical protein
MADAQDLHGAHYQLITARRGTLPAARHIPWRGQEHRRVFANHCHQSLSTTFCSPSSLPRHPNNHNILGVHHTTLIMPARLLQHRHPASPTDALGHAELAAAIQTSRKLYITPSHPRSPRGGLYAPYAQGLVSPNPIRRPAADSGCSTSPPARTIVDRLISPRNFPSLALKHAGTYCICDIGRTPDSAYTVPQLSARRLSSLAGGSTSCRCDVVCTVYFRGWCLCTSGRKQTLLALHRTPDPAGPGRSHGKQQLISPYAIDGHRRANIARYGSRRSLAAATVEIARRITLGTCIASYSRSPHQRLDR